MKKKYINETPLKSTLPRNKDPSCNSVPYHFVINLYYGFIIKRRYII